MNILFYTNPFITRNKLDFYSGAINKKLIPQAQRLVESGHKVSILLNRASYNNVDQLYFSLIDFIVIDAEQCFDIERKYNKIEEEIYKENESCINDMTSWFLEQIDYEYDCVIAWETPVSFIQKALPASTVISEMPGILSRIPYPELYIFDTDGLFKHSMLARTNFEISDQLVDSKAEDLLNIINERGVNVIRKITPFTRSFLDPNNEFEYLYLLPLQVPGQYAYDTEDPYTSLTSQVIDILNQIPSNHGLVLTKYTAGGYDGGLDNLTINNIKQQFPNLIYHKAFESLDNISQYILPNIDAVITHSSSIGIQGLLFNKVLITPNSKYLFNLCDFKSITEFLEKRSVSREVSLEEKEKLNRNKVKWMLAYHQPLAGLILRDDEFLNKLIYSKINNSNDSFFEIYPDYNEAVEKLFKSNRAISDIDSIIGLPDTTFGIKTEHEFAKTINQVQPHLISFDIFDTLLERTYEQPSHLFKAMEPEVNKLTSDLIQNFASIRPRVERSLRSKLKDETGRQDITFYQIYKQIAIDYNLDKHTIQSLMELELDYEFNSLRTRKIGKKLFEIALEQGCKVILISDMYLPKEFLLKVLDKQGFSEFSEFYLSCDIGLRKHEGELYDYVLENEKIKPENWLHIGDNPHGDIKVAQEKEINVFHLKSSFVILGENKKLGPLIREDKKSRTVLESLVYGTIQCELFDKPFDRYSNITHAGGSARNVGFVALGPLLLGFLSWIMHDAKKEGIDKLYFLSRDGKILYQMCNILYPVTDGWPEREYALSSRRSALVAGLKSKSDIVDLVDSSIANNVSISNLFSSKFGLILSKNHNYKLQKYGFKDVDHKINVKYDREGLREFALSISEDILLNARKERERLVKYYTEIGMNSGNIALIDIGYAGTMQASLFNILDNNSINGYYFITFEKALENLRVDYFIKAYTENFVKPHLSKELISKNGFFYETLFCSSDHSFIKFEEDANSKIYPIYDVYPDSNRVNMINEVHQGVLEFSKLIGDLLPLPDSHSIMVPSVASRIFDDLLKSPSGLDAGIFEGVEFDDGFAGADLRYIIAPREAISKDKDRALKNSIWKQGAAVFSRRPDIFDTKKAKPNPTKNAQPTNRHTLSSNQVNATRPSNNSYESQINERSKVLPSKLTKGLLKSEEKVIGRLVSEAKYRKYKRNREAFFKDSKKSLANFYVEVTRKL
ncbi:HAD family hydrolase [Psychrobacter celer]|uniref:HAD family hydrolase n=1 Tax=Psychrobacter celer TaxID=306572 RepID=UPI003FD6BF1E